MTAVDLFPFAHLLFMTVPTDYFCGSLSFRHFFNPLPLLPFSPFFLLLIATSLSFLSILFFFIFLVIFLCHRFFSSLSRCAVVLFFYFKISFFVLLSFVFFQLCLSFSLSLISTFAYLSTSPIPLSFSFASAFLPHTDIIPYFHPFSLPRQNGSRQSGRSSNTPACG